MFTFRKPAVVMAAAVVLMAMQMPSWPVKNPPSTSSAAGISGWQKVTGSTQGYYPPARLSNSTMSSEQHVYCPAGKKVLGGGWHAVRAGQVGVSEKEGFTVAISRPTDDGTGWKVYFTYKSGGDNFWVNVFAICADVA